MDDSEQGSAYVYERIAGRWIMPDLKVRAPIPEGDDRFGGAVAVDGNRAAVGAISGNTDAADT